VTDSVPNSKTDIVVAKRRASAARLLACLVPIGCALAGGNIAAADAAPVAPKLVTTNPTSSHAAPATVVTPSVLGEAEPEDGIIIESYPRFNTFSWGPTTAAVEHPTKHPGYEIQIFAGGECLGAPIATGTSEALEAGGITVGVQADAKTIISAVQVDPAEPEVLSRCSNPLSYWEGNVPPEEEANGGGGSTGGGGGSGGGTEGSSGGTTQTPAGGSVGNATPVTGKPDAPHIHTNSGARANNATPVILGSAQNAASVSVYANENCNGAPIAKGSPGQLSAGFPVTVAPNSTTVFSAMAFGEQHSSCSDPVSYTEDSLAPRTRITMGPGVKTRKRQVTFRFQDITEDPPGTTFRCKVDKKRWRPCSSPFHLNHLKPGRHVLAIRATDLAGNVEPKPVKRRFIVVRRSAS
jgi:uncharacterized membrane protein YgcG